MMALLEGQFQVRDLVMGPGTVYEMLTETNPFDRQVRADQGDDRAWNHGAWSGVEWMNKAGVRFRIFIDTPDTASWIDARNRLVKAFRPVGEATADVEMRFRIGGTEYVMFGRPRGAGFQTQLISTGRSFAQADFTALDPFIYGDEQSYTGIGLPQFEGGLTVPGSSSTLNSNTSFESGLSPWTAFNGTATQASTRALIGTYSAEMTPDGASAQNYLESEKVTVTAGEEYLVSAWVWFNSAVSSNYSTSINWYDSTDTYLDTSSNNVSAPAGEWNRVENVFTAPTNAASATMLPTLSGTPTQTWYIDAASLQSTSTPDGLTVPFTIDATLSDGFADITNAGTAESGMFVRIDGPAVEPSVTLQRDDGEIQTLRFDFTVRTGHWLEVDTAARTVMLNGTTNRRSRTTGDFPQVPPGTHRLRWQAGNYDEQAEMSVTVRSAWW